MSIVNYGGNDYRGQSPVLGGPSGGPPRTLGKYLGEFDFVPSGTIVQAGDTVTYASQVYTRLKDGVILQSSPPSAGSIWSSNLGSLNNLFSRKPTTGYFQYIDADNGDDLNDGLSSGSAKKTVAAAVLALPNGGAIEVTPSSNEYLITAKVTLAGHSFFCEAFAPGGVHSLALFRHKFDGNMFEISAGSVGAQFRNILFYEDDVQNRTGCAIYGASTAVDITGNIYLENCIFSGGNGWERNVVLDGSLMPNFGVRKCVFQNCQFFGTRTGENLVLTRPVHHRFTGCFVDQAPTAVNQIVKILDVGASDVHFSGMSILGDFYTEAGDGCSYTGRITGNVTCAVGSQKNVFDGYIGGAFTNNGAKTSTAANRQVAHAGVDNVWQVTQSHEGFISGKAAGGLVLTGNANGAAGFIELANAASVGVTRVQPEAGALHVQQGVLLSKRAVAIPAPAAGGQLAVRDNGSGKNQLAIQFPTGAVQIIATEP